MIEVRLRVQNPTYRSRLPMKQNTLPRPNKLPFSLTGRFFGPRVFSADQAFVAQRDGVWEIATGQKRVAFPSTVEALAFAPDNRLVLSGHNDNSVRLWDIATGRELRQFVGHTAPVHAVAFFPDSKRIVTGGYDKTLRLWETATGKLLVVKTNHTKEISSVGVFLEGQRIVTSAYDNTTRVWEGRSGKPLCVLDTKLIVPSALTFSPDGQRLVTTYYTCTVWDLRTGNLIKKIISEHNQYYAAAFSPDGKRLATTDQQGSVVLWDTETWQETLTLPTSDYVLSLTFTPDGQRLTAHYRDRKEQTWQAS